MRKATGAVPLTLADGATALTVTASDAVGNESAAVADTSWTIDTTARGGDDRAHAARPGDAEPESTLEVAGDVHRVGDRRGYGRL